MSSNYINVLFQDSLKNELDNLPPQVMKRVETLKQIQVIINQFHKYLLHNVYVGMSTQILTFVIDHVIIFVV